MSWVLLADVVGSSVLTFAGVAATLGWLLTLTIIPLFCYLAYYCAVLMAKTHAALLDQGGLAFSMGEAVRLASDRPQLAAAMNKHCLSFL